MLVSLLKISESTTISISEWDSSSLSSFTETILKDILHFNDLNTDRIDVLKKIFDYGELNVYMEDFLKFETDIKFNLIVANPPYAKLDANGKRTAKNHNLIGLFINKSLIVIKNK